MTEIMPIFEYIIFGVIPNGFKTYLRSNERIGGIDESLSLYHPIRSLEFLFMEQFKELIGQKFNQLTIVEVLEKKIPNTCRKCIAICECGKSKEFILKHVKYGRTISCGCAYGKSNIIHGYSHTPLSRVFDNMRNRCYNDKCEEYHNYGGRGIRICDEWLANRKNFFDWALSNGYDERLQIDRENVNGNYEPTNCRFVTSKVNANNKRNNFYITKDGTTKTVSEWCDGSEIRPSIVASRLRNGWNLDTSISTPVINQGRILEYNGDTKTLTEWSNILGIKVCTLWRRLHNGWSVDKALGTRLNTNKSHRCN